MAVRLTAAEATAWPVKKPAVTRVRPRRMRASEPARVRSRPAPVSARATAKVPRRPAWAVRVPDAAEAPVPTR